MRRLLPIVIGVIAIIAAGFFVLNRTRIEEVRRAAEQKTLPAAESLEEAVTEPETTSTPMAAAANISPKPNSITSEKNLAVPFTSQAPYGVWDEVHEETCEEATAAMADAFYTKRTFTPESAERELLALVEWQKKRFGYFEDTSAEEVAVILREYYKFPRVLISEEVTVSSIKREIARGNLIILPLYGRGLNPFFTPPGPDYHMLLVKGFTETKFITNDPGTRRGADFTYTFDKLLSAVHDWNDGDILNGRKVMIIVFPK